MTMLFAKKDQRSDAELVAASRHGNREAFGQIVRRYQGMISGLIYSCCGDLHKSEDLAQETFVSAWKSLSGLRKPQRLAAWLCQIARHRVTDGARSAAREGVRLAHVVQATREEMTAGPEQEMMSAEERELLWRTLSQIPSPYRETLVLYYRQSQSAADVALAMDVSEETVRQRLGRGRQMLREQVALMLERDLSRSSPGSAFAVGVLAALPSVAPHALASAGAGAAAKAGGAAKIAGWLGAMISVAAAGVGAIAADWGRVRYARSPRERKFLIKANWGFWVGLLIWNAVWINVAAALYCRDGVVQPGFTGFGVWWLGLFGPLFAFRIWMARRQKQIQMEDGTAGPMPSLLDPTRKGFKAIVYGSLAALIWGGGSWLAMVGRFTGDWVLVVLWPALSLVAWLACAGVVVRHPEKARGVFLGVLWGLMAAVLLVVNLRWNVWRSGAGEEGLDTIFRLGVNFLLVVFYGSIALAWWLRPKLSAAGDVKKRVAVVVTLYLAVLLLGIILGRMTKL